jgi:hypothetical protein
VKEGEDDPDRKYISDEDEWGLDDAAEEDDAPFDTPYDTPYDTMLTARKARESGQSMLPPPMSITAKSKGGRSPPSHWQPVSTTLENREDKARPRSRNKPRSPLRRDHFPGSNARNTGNDFSDVHGSSVSDDTAYSGQRAQVPRAGRHTTKDWDPTEVQPAGLYSLENEDRYSKPSHQEPTTMTGNRGIQPPASGRARDGKVGLSGPGDFQREFGGLSIEEGRSGGRQGQSGTARSSELHQHQPAYSTNTKSATERWKGYDSGGRR